MNDYQPGRVYSGVIDGKRRLLFCGGGRETEFSWINDHGMRRSSPRSGVDPTDVRGPLVVLDHHDFPNVLRDLREGDRDAAADWIADQIEEQTQPPLQVGWHEVRESLPPRYWDGHVWRYGPRTDPTHEVSFTSTHYIGPGSQS